MISNIGEGATPLMYACQQSREKEVLDLIARKRNSVRERDRTLKTPLHYCTENPTIGCAEAVLRGAPELLDAKDEDGYTALHLAVIAGNKTFLRFLISRGANVNALDNERHSAVHWATVCGEEEALDIILRAGANVSTADVHGGYPLHYAAQMCGPGGEMGRDPKIGLRILNILLSNNIDINVEDKDGRQPILWAASAVVLLKQWTHLIHPPGAFPVDVEREAGGLFSGSAEAILSLVKAGASVEASDKDGLTALHCAASRGHTDCIETLVTLCGANIDVIDTNGCTALFYAVTLGHADASQLLLSLGAEPNRQDRKGRTPAHCGAAKGQLETLRILLNYGANLWLRNVKGDFPLHEAIASGRRDLVRWLLNQRPDSINVGNNDGRCPIHIAAINNNVDMTKILLDAQSLVNPIMRTTKGTLMTPLDAALYRGFRGCAKYIQLHGGVPFTKLTEKSSNIRGISSRQITSDMYLDNYGDRLGVSNWGKPQTSSTSPPACIPVQIRMGGDNAIQQIQTSDMRAVIRLPEECDDFRSSDEEKVYRRRRRRKKWESQRKGYNSEEEDSNGDVTREAEHLRRRQRPGVEGSRYSGQKKREQYDGSSSESDYYRRKTMKKRDSASDSDERRDTRRMQHCERRRYHSATEDSENEGKRERKRKSRKDSSSKTALESEISRREKTDFETKVDATDNSRKSSARREMERSAIVEIHETPISEAAVVEKAPTAVSDNQEEPQPEENEMVDANKTLEAPEVIEASEEVITKVTVDAVEAEKSTTPPPVADEPKPEEIASLENQPELDVDVTIDEVKENQEEVKMEEPEAEMEPEAANTQEEPVEVEESEAANPPEEQAETSKIDEDIPEEEVEAVNTTENITEEAREAVEDITEQEVDLTEDVTEGLAGGIDQERTEENEEPTSALVVDDEEEDEEDEDEEEVDEEEVEEEGNGDECHENAFEVLENVSNSASSNRIRNDLGEGSSSRRGSDSGVKEYRPADPDGSLGGESGISTRNEDSSALLDSGIEPSPRTRMRDTGDSASAKSRVPRLCNRGKEPEEMHSVSVTQTVQNTIRKYHMERRIFYQLLELKRLQIRAGRANEQVLVKRLVDEYRRNGIVPGLKNYSGPYTFRQFEKFLYDQLRTLQSTAHILIPNLRPSDDIETLSTILRKSRVELVDDIPDNPMFCTQGTHRCHHATHAYTGIPCAAYITKLNHHEMPKTKSTGFLPHIDQSYTDRSATQQGSRRPVTLEVSHGKEKQVISLPTDRLDKNKRYYVTFTIKGGPPLEESKSAGHEERMLRHRHAKSF